MDDNVEELLKKVSEETHGEDLLGGWLESFDKANLYKAKLFTRFYFITDEARLRAKEDIEKTYNNDANLRDSELNFIRKMLMSDQLGAGYGIEHGDELAQCFLNSMRQMQFWRDTAKALESDLIEELLDTVERMDEPLMSEWFKCFDECRGEQNPPTATTSGSRLMFRRQAMPVPRSISLQETQAGNSDCLRLRARREIRNMLRTGINTQTDFIRKLLIKDKTGGYEFGEGPRLARIFLVGMKSLPCWEIFAEKIEEHFTDKLLGKVSEINNTLLADWKRCFGENDTDQQLQAKCEIKNTMRNKESQCDRKINFIMRLASGGYTDTKRGSRLAELFLLVMRKEPYWEECVQHTVEHSRSKHIEGASVIYRASKNPMNLNEIKQRYREMLLHEAARLEDVDLVNNLVNDIKEEEWTSGELHECTPLHSAAMAIRPNAQIAKSIVEAMKKETGHLRMINIQSDEESGHNTALHIAAGNVNVTQEFIDELKDADPVIFNKEHYSPFHVAGKSKNQDVIIYMLNTFAPTNNRWDVDEVDVDLPEHKRCEDRLINICARNGNAKAVALLIQHGANISLGVLHEIILESVRRPDKIGKLLDVYQSIVDNAVTWRCLEEDRVSPLKGSDAYNNEKRETVIWLLTNPLAEYQDRDVLEYAMSRAASAMFRQIVNTVGVFRDVHFDNESVPEMQITSDRMHASLPREVNFDVTNFTEETFEEQMTGQQTAEEKDARRPRRNFKERRRPNVPYLTFLLRIFNRWEDDNILSTQPLKQLTKPYFALIQRFYFLLGLMQLLFMVLFSMNYTPNTCSLSPMFNVSVAHCNGSNSELLLDANNNTTSSNAITQPRSLLTFFWLIWPIIL